MYIYIYIYIYIYVHLQTKALFYINLESRLSNVCCCLLVSVTMTPFRAAMIMRCRAALQAQQLKSVLCPPPPI
jgi:hypothetical protein